MQEQVCQQGSPADRVSCMSHEAIGVKTGAPPNLRDDLIAEDVGLMHRDQETRNLDQGRQRSRASPSGCSAESHRSIPCGPCRPHQQVCHRSRADVAKTHKQEIRNVLRLTARSSTPPRRPAPAEKPPFHSQNPDGCLWKSATDAYTLFPCSYRHSA